MSFWKRNRGFAVFSLFLVVMIGFLSYHATERSNPSFAEGLVLQIFAPFERGISQVMQSVSKFADDVRGLLTLRARNSELQAELDALRLQNNFLVEVERENQRLRLLLDYKRAQPDLEVRLARVIGISENPWQQELIIDQGARDGVEVDTAVITYAGLAGRVYEVGPSTSKIVLITDPRGPVAAQIQETRVRGTIEADPGIPGQLRLIRLPRDAEVQPGFTVITAGTGGLNLPPGLVIGRVTSIEFTPDGLQQVAAVQPTVDFNSLEQVLLATQAGGR